MSEETAVTSDASSAGAGETSTPAATTGGTTTESGNQSPAATAQAPQRTENSIPHHRVEEMRRRDRDEIAALRKQQMQYEALLKRVNGGIEAMGRGFGFIKDEEPQYVDAKTFETKVNSLKASIESQYREEMLFRELTSEWRQVSAKHAKWAAVPGFKEACLSVYAQDASKDLGTIADEIATQYGKLLAAQAQETVQTAVTSPAAKVVKPGGGTGAPAPKDRKGSVSERVSAMLRQRGA